MRGQGRHRTGAPCRAGSRASTRLRLRARDAREWNEHAKVARLIEHRVAVDGQPLRKACSVEVYCQSDDVLIRSHRLEGDDGAAEREREHRVPAKVRADVHHYAVGGRAALARAVAPNARELWLHEQTVPYVEHVLVEWIIGIDKGRLGGGGKTLEHDAVGRAPSRLRAGTAEGAGAAFGPAAHGCHRDALVVAHGCETAGARRATFSQGRRRDMLRPARLEPQVDDHGLAWSRSIPLASHRRGPPERGVHVSTAVARRRSRSSHRRSAPLASPVRRQVKSSPET